MGGPNLEIFKFGMYIAFPIGWMYYFGTNLDRKFSVEDFWPTRDQLNKIPTERGEILGELERLRNRRLQRREDRLKEEAEMEAMETGIPLELTNAMRELGKQRMKGGALKQMGEGGKSAMEREGSAWMQWAKSR